MEQVSSKCKRKEVGKEFDLLGMFYYYYRKRWEHIDSSVRPKSIPEDMQFYMWEQLDHICS